MSYIHAHKTSKQKTKNAGKSKGKKYSKQMIHQNRQQTRGNNHPAHNHSKLFKENGIKSKVHSYEVNHKLMLLQF